VVCTAALALYLGHPSSSFLSAELDRVKREAIYQTRVFFVRNLGFVTPTAARGISSEDTPRLEKIHEEVYRDLGFELISKARSLSEKSLNKSEDRWNGRSRAVHNVPWRKAGTPRSAIARSSTLITWQLEMPVLTSIVRDSLV
jgi:hypothetical protein